MLVLGINAVFHDPAAALVIDGDLAPCPGEDLTADGWEDLRTLYARRAPLVLRTALPEVAGGLAEAVGRLLGDR